MVVIKNKRGVGLLDLTLTVALLAISGVIFSAAFPTAFSASRQAQEYKIATAIATEKAEQLRAMHYESLTRSLLASAGIIDADNGYSFTERDAIASQLCSGTGAIEITDVTADVKRVRITVSWLSKQNTTRSVQITTLIADKRPRAVT
jgi:type II secretory pathway pseudopilin PulG